MNKNKKITKWLLVASLLFSNGLLSAEEAQPTYAKKAGTELSLGFSNLALSNFESFSMNLLPAMNYYFFDRIFGRAGLQLGMDLDQRQQMPNLYRIAPEIGIGYTLPIAGRWYVSAFGYYRHGYAASSGASSNSSPWYQFAGLTPELKYQISQNWLVAIQAEINSNLPNVINGNHKVLRSYTEIRIVVSYYLP